MDDERLRCIYLQNSLLVSFCHSPFFSAPFLYFKTFNPSIEHLKTLLKNNGNYITLSKEELKKELAILLNGEIKGFKEKIAKDKKTLATLNKDYKSLF